MEVSLYTLAGKENRARLELQGTGVTTAKALCEGHTKMSVSGYVPACHCYEKGTAVHLQLGRGTMIDPAKLARSKSASALVEPLHKVHKWAATFSGGTMEQVAGVSGNLRGSAKASKQGGFSQLALRYRVGLTPSPRPQSWSWWLRRTTACRSACP